MAERDEKYTRRRLQSSYLTTLVSITLVLLMLGVFGLIILHSAKLSDYVRENIGFSIIMNDKVKEADIIRLQKSLDVWPSVKSTEYITKDQAATDLTKELGEDFIGFLGYNPLLPSIEVRFNAAYTSRDSLNLYKTKILTDSNVKEVFYQESLVEAINKNIRKIGMFLLSFSILLLIISFALINNTIRLSVYSRRFLIRTMQLVGATQQFIARPFIVRGIIQGLIASFISILLLTGVIIVSQNEIPELVSLQDVDMFLSLFLSVIALGVIISWLSNLLAVRKYLNSKIDDLYI